MKKLLPFTFIFLIACNKDSIKPKPQPNGIVNYNIEGDSIKIVDSASNSVARWIYINTPIKGYALQAYYAKSGSEVSHMVSFFIETDKIVKGGGYSDRVTGSILRNGTDYASTKGLQGTDIKININGQKDQTLSGTFTGTLKNLGTDEFVEISGNFDNVKIKE